MQVIARSSQAACHSFLTVRLVGIVAARRSTALRLTRSARMTSRSSGIPGLRSSFFTGGRTGTIWRSRSVVLGAFMLAGECEPPPQKSTQSRAPAAGGHGLGHLGPGTLLFALRGRRDQRRDLLAQRLITGWTAGLVRHEAAERERPVGRRRPVHQRLRGPEVAGGTIRLARLAAEIGGLLRIEIGRAHV